jgi:hypothetical protein
LSNPAKNQTKKKKKKQTKTKKQKTKCRSCDHEANYAGFAGVTDTFPQL